MTANMNEAAARAAAYGDEDSKKAGKRTKALLVAFFALCLAFLVEAAVYKLILPSMGTPRIVFNGRKKISERVLSDALGYMRNLNWFAFNPEDALESILSIEAVESARVSKRFPDRVNIDITEREGVATIFVSTDGRCVPFQIDRTGVLFDGGLADGEESPIISGIPIERMTAGMRVPEKYRALIDQIQSVRALPRNYFAAISEICVVPKEYGSYELMLIPAKSRTRVFTDRSLSEDALQYMMVALDVVNSIERDVDEVDLRYGSISFKAKESPALKDS